ncbi:hypothetical protein D3C77_171280 [compost metagenome]
MNIDKSKLQSLLWAVVGAWRAGDQDLQVHTDALDGFLGAHTVEEVALQLLAELNLAGEVCDAYAADKKRLAFALNDARAEAAALRKELDARHPFKLAQDVPVIGFTGCVICGVYTEHGGLQCPKLRAFSVTAGKEASHG